MMKQSIGIVIPTYNETGSISMLIKRIYAYLPDAIVMIVDDSNPQENEKLKKIIKRLNPSNSKRLILISRLKKSGRGSAVIAGFKEMLKNKSVTYFFEMDADLAHDSKEFKDFLNAINIHNADIVIGSRYLHSSRITKWPLWRLILSKIINTFTNIFLNLKLSDYTNGFRLYKRNAVEFLMKIQLKEKGFIALSEIAFRLKNNNFKIIEIPISFTDRKYGKSSANYKEFTSAFIGLFRIKMSPMELRK